MTLCSKYSDNHRVGILECVKRDWTVTTAVMLSSFKIFFESHIIVGSCNIVNSIFESIELCHSAFWNLRVCVIACGLWMMILYLLNMYLDELKGLYFTNWFKISWSVSCAIQLSRLVISFLNILVVLLLNQSSVLLDKWSVPLVFPSSLSPSLPHSFNPFSFPSTLPSFLWLWITLFTVCTSNKVNFET